ncbi:putative peptidoglycan-binding domain-containing protein [Pseudomonas aeruginosa]|nr:N-acetylmuramidase family protein [Pseudomonas aeruginosa]SQC90482.1 putative peptidoglycan-binding domain-containing protein [Pseudomonas aeruginosa]
MYRRLAAHDQVTADQLAAQFPALVNPRPGGYAGGTAEHHRLANARQIDDTAALESASWGAFQIMGFHWQRLGYVSVQAFAEAMGRSESAQFEAFVRFIDTDPALHKALKARKWADFRPPLQRPRLQAEPLRHQARASLRATRQLREASA